MIKIKAYFLFILFCASTVASFATVHRCEGKITDLEFFTIAECGHHEKEEAKPCHTSCCAADEKEEDHEPCCDTSQLADNDYDLVKTFVQSTSFASQIILQSFEYSFERIVSSKEVLRYSSYSPPPLIRDIQIDIQCFRI